LTQYLIGTGGWGYFPTPSKPSLKLYSKIFSFVEVNQTFYEFPDMKTVERWRKTVPDNFTFAVRCNQLLTHRLGLEPIDEAYYILGQMVAYCGILNAPYLVLETPHKYSMTREMADRARDLFSSWDLNSIRLAWEYRAPINQNIINLMQDFNIIQCVDLSRETPYLNSDVTYSRLFGKGKHNIYQFTDDELMEIEQKAEETNSKTVALSYHGLRMSTDALRFQQYKLTGKFMPVTDAVGVDSARAVLSEDAKFPSTKQALAIDQGWKVIDVTANKRAHLSEFLSKIPDKNYTNIDEIIQELRAVL
jgi:uncharacterized protein YecE (DUF72 family)